MWVPIKPALCDEVASERCFSAATFVRQRAVRTGSLDFNQEPTDESLIPEALAHLTC